MYASLPLVLALASLAAANPAVYQKRTPSDKSGKSTMAFACDDVTLPQPGGESDGSGGVGLFTTDMVFTDASGVKHHPDACTSDGAYCGNCIISGGGLSSATNVTGCSNPAAGACDLTFLYNGYGYDTSKGQPKCGHDNSFEAFGDTKTAICYFDV